MYKRQVLTRVLSDNKALHTTTGHVALGWLVVEDLFTILLLVLLPAIVGGNEQSESVWHVLAVTTLKLGALVVFALVVGQRIIPKLLAYVAVSYTHLATGMNRGLTDLVDSSVPNS